MNTLAKLIASIAALIASLTLAWIARDGVEIHHKGSVDAELSFAPMPLRITHEYL
jgi:hypothetical protein